MRFESRYVPWLAYGIEEMLDVYPKQIAVGGRAKQSIHIHKNNHSYRVGAIMM